MLGLRTAALSLLFLAAAFSGCTSAAKHGISSDGVNLGNGNSIELPQPDNSPTTGSISGVVVDEAVRPLANVSIAVSGDSVEVHSDGNGLFVETGLQPGLYTLRAGGGNFTGKHYLDSQTTAEVKAGETTKVRILMVLDPTPQPFHADTLKFDGFFQVAEGYADEVLDLSVWNHTYGPITTPPSPGCTCQFSFSADGNTSTIVGELVWKEPTPGNPMPNYWNMDLKYANGSVFNYCEKGSPCVYPFEQPGNWTSGDRDFRIGVWTDPTWLYVNQKFELFVTLFYLAPAPPGWSFVNGST